MIKKKSSPAVSFHFLLKGFSLTQRTALKGFLHLLFKKEGKSLASLSYIFCNDKYLLDINKQYLKHDFYTDIITFDLSEGKAISGEIYISIDRVKENAVQFNTSFREELRRVIFHGALHLCGYKDKTNADEKIMRTKELEYLNKYKRYFF